MELTVSNVQLSVVLVKIHHIVILANQIERYLSAMLVFVKLACIQWQEQLFVMLVTILVHLVSHILNAHLVILRLNDFFLDFLVFVMQVTMMICHIKSVFHVNIHAYFVVKILHV